MDMSPSDMPGYEAAGPDNECGRNAGGTCVEQELSIYERSVTLVNLVDTFLENSFD
jgi:hypothetical protein